MEGRDGRTTELPEKEGSGDPCSTTVRTDGELESL